MSAFILTCYFFVFLFGLITGSFLNVVIYRLEIGEKLGGRSYCPHCRQTLRWIDLIPVASFLLLGGKCGHCKGKISVEYPIVEILTGLVFILIFNYQLPRFELSLLTQAGIFYFLFSIFSFYIASSLIVIFIYDLKHYIIPDKVLIPSIAVTVIYQLIFQFNFFVFNSLPAALAISFIFTAIFLLSRGKWMGFGDCKLVILLGLILGYPLIFPGMFLSFLFGSIIGLGLMVLGKKGLKSEVPFAPFLIIGTASALLFGDKII